MPPSTLPNEPFDPKRVFNKATQLMDQRAFTEAEQVLRTGLLKAANDPNLLRVLGLSLLRQNKLQEAREHLTHVTRLVPTFGQAYEDLASALLALGDLEAAIKALQSAVHHTPHGSPHASGTAMRLTELLAYSGRGKEADSVFEAMLDGDPDRATLVTAMKLVRDNNLKEAEQLYRKVLRQRPDQVDALRLLGLLKMRTESYSEAESLFRRAVELAPDYWAAWLNLGVAFNEQQKFEKAEEAYKRALAIRPENIQIFEKLGGNCMNDGRMEDAIHWLEKGLAITPDHFQSLLVLGHALKTIGRQEDAIDAYKKCAAAKPEFGEVYWSLANLKTYRFTDEELAHMEEQLTGVEENPAMEASEISLLFALGKAAEDKKDFTKAFYFYERGNTKKRLSLAYDPIEFETHIDRLIDVYAEDFFSAREGQGHDDGSPIFIVGLPRSGSTLQEQILASHSRVEGTAELHYLLRIATEAGINRADGLRYPQCMTVLKEYQIKDLGEEYISLTKPHRTGAPYFTDKLPNNFVGIGLLHTILPNAKIIDARRHPLDSCLGCYKQLFAKGQPFTYDFYDLAHYYTQYLRLMDHWHKVLPGKVLTVHYEDVVANLEENVRRVAGHCGLEFEDQMLRFHETNRAVKTASSEQVRQPLYAGSVNLWRRYEDQLGDLIDFLEPVLMTLPEKDRPKKLL